MDIEKLEKKKPAKASITKPTGKAKVSKQVAAKNPRSKKTMNKNLDLLEGRNQSLKENATVKHKDNFEEALWRLQENYMPDSLPCREKEKKIIEDFIKSGLSNRGNSQTLCRLFLTETSQVCPE